MPYRDHYLDALLRHEGRGRYVKQGCSSCRNVTANYRCQDCHGGRLWCQACIIWEHRDEPLHKLEVCRCFFFFFHVESLLLMTSNHRNGQVPAFVAYRPLLSACPSNWAMLVVLLVLYPNRQIRISSSFIKMAFTTYRSTFVVAILRLTSTNNSSMWAGSLRHRLNQRHVHHSPFSDSSTH